MVELFFLLSPFFYSTWILFCAFNPPPFFSPLLLHCIYFYLASPRRCCCCLFLIALFFLPLSFSHPSIVHISSFQLSSIGCFHVCMRASDCLFSSALSLSLRPYICLLCLIIRVLLPMYFKSSSRFLCMLSLSLSHTGSKFTMLGWV